MSELITFIIAGAGVLAGALGVVLFPHPVHAALSLVGTLFGVAVLFVAQEAHFLAAVQVIVYAGAIVVLFLFVIMLLGVDTSDDLAVEPLTGQRPVAVIAGLAILGLSLAALFVAGGATGSSAEPATIGDGAQNIDAVGRALFADFGFAFEITAILLTIAVIGAVLLARRTDTAPEIDVPADAEPAGVDEARDPAEVAS